MKQARRNNYQLIESEIKHRIVNQEWKPSEKIASCRSLSKEYGCSPNTIEKALKSLESSGFVIRQERKGTIVSETVRRKETSGLIAAFVTGIDNPLWMSALRGIEDYLHDFGISMITGSHDFSTAKLKSTLDNLSKVAVDGVIISPPLHNENDRIQFCELIENLLERSIKVVFIDRFVYNLSIPYVTTDNISASYRLTKLLLDNGHREIGFVRRSTHVSTIEERFTGFKQACYEMEIPENGIFDFMIQTEQDDFRDEFDRFCTQMEHKLMEHKVTALFASNDQVAKAILLTLKRMNLRVPEDISLVMYDVKNLRQNSLPQPGRITGVCQDFYGMGRLAVDVLMNQIYSESNTAEIQLGHIVPSEIIVGNSIQKLNGR